MYPYQFIGAHRGDSVSKWTMSMHFQVYRFFIQARASVTHFHGCTSARGWLDGGARNYRPDTQKRMELLI